MLYSENQEIAAAQPTARREARHPRTQTQIQLSPSLVEIEEPLAERKQRRMREIERRHGR